MAEKVRKAVGLTDDMLILERPHTLGLAPAGFVQRLYRLPNGYGLSLINNPMLHAHSFAWEAAVLTGMREDGRFVDLTYDTPLTDDVEVFHSDDEANAFIAKAKAWAESETAKAGAA